MYTRATVVDNNDPSRLLHVRRLLLDTGAHGGNYCGRPFLEANRDFLRGMIKTSDTSVFLADGVTELKIDESVDLTLRITTFSGKLVVITANFCVIDSMCDIILGFNDMVLQAGAMLIEMIQRAIDFSRQEARHESASSQMAAQDAPQSVVQQLLPIWRPWVTAPHATLRFDARDGRPNSLSNMRAAFAELSSNSTLPAPQAVSSPTPPVRSPFKPTTILKRGKPRGRGESSRAPDGAHRQSLSNLTAGGARAVQDTPMLASETAQDLRRPWSVIDELGPEEDETGFTGMFPDSSLSFMETSIEVARAEYLKEVSTPPTPTPLQVVVATAGAGDTTSAKPPKRGRFSPDMYALPGFVEYLRDVAIDVFVPNNWEGIRMPPIEFVFKPDMPDTHRSKSRPINRQRLEMVHKEVDRLRKYHLVPSSSSIVSPISDADKATEPFVRICGDYRWVNTMINLDHQFIPRVQHELERFSKFKFFIDLDMVNSFHQFKLGEFTSGKLSIITPWGTFRPVFMPEGVSPATGVLQANMREIFKDFADWAIVIFDNFCIGGHSLQDVFEKFKLFVERCKLFNIFLKFAKCYFGWRDVKFFGYQCDGEGWQIDDERKVAIRAIPFPTGLTTKVRITRMQSFLGFSLYFRDFVDHYSIRAAPLYDMTVKGFVWDESAWALAKIDYHAIFDEFKEAMCNCFKLIFPDYELPWILQPDASAVGIGAILFQVRTITDGTTGVVTTRREPIACISHKFSDPATRWAVIKQEMYAIYRAVDKLSYYLRYKAFQIQTDHSNLVHMEKSNVGIITRWRIFLQSFPILSIVHVAGKENIAADFLSRVHECDLDKLPDDVKKQLALLSAACLSDTHSGEALDDELEGFTAALRLQFLASRESAPGCVRDEDDDHRNICDDVYCRNCGDDFQELCNVEQIVDTSRQKADKDTFTEHVPEWDAILATAHAGTAMHWAALPTWRTLQEHYVHNIPFAYVEFYIRECATCQKYRKTLTRDRIAPITRHLKVASARSTLGIDGFSMTPPDKHGNCHMHVIINHFTKHVFLYVCKEKTAVTGADAIITYMAMFGRHDRIISDPGSDYTSNVVDQLNKYLGYLHAFSLVDRHESNGTEPTNREIARHVKALVFDLSLRDCWSEPRILALVTFEINNHRSSESNYTAFDLTFGSMHKEYFTSLGAESVEPIESYGTYIQELDKNIKNIRELSLKHQFGLARRRSTDTSLPRNMWQPGDRVLLDNLSPANKMQAPRLGPYAVVRHIKNEVFLKNLVTGLIKPFYVGRLSLYTGSLDEALKAARSDTDQHLVERISGYRGDVDKRETMEFRVEFTDGMITWKRFEKDLTDTAQYESYCESLPQLRPLLSLATEVSRQKALLSRTLTADTHAEGTVIFVDIRARPLYESEWYLALVLDDKDVRHRYARLKIGKIAIVRGTKKGSRAELIDEAFGLVHRIDPYFLYVHGTVRSRDDLPEDSEIVDMEFARANPYKPINTDLHRRLVTRDLATVVQSVATVRILSRNVNGFDQATKKGFLEELKQMAGGPPDLLLMQETKAHACDDSRIERALARLGYIHFHMVPGVQPQYAGVAIASKTKFRLLGNTATEGGRTLSVSVLDFVVTNIYAPIICSNLDHMIERRRDFDDATINLVQSLPEPNLVCGDFNSVSDISMDLELPTRMKRNFGGFQTRQETRLVEELQARGYKDTFRLINPVERAFTCFAGGSWKGLRARIDFAMASPQMNERVLDCRIMPRTPASDHAGVLVTIEARAPAKVWPDFTELFNTPLQYCKDWLGYAYRAPPPPQEPVTIFMMFARGQPPPPPPPPPTPGAGKGPPDSNAQRKLTAKEKEELELAEFDKRCFEFEAQQQQELDEAKAFSMLPIEATPAEVMFTPRRRIPSHRLEAQPTSAVRMTREEFARQRASARRWANTTLHQQGQRIAQTSPQVQVCENRWAPRVRHSPPAAVLPPMPPPPPAETPRLPFIQYTDDVEILGTRAEILAWQADRDAIAQLPAYLTEPNRHWATHIDEDTGTTFMERLPELIPIPHVAPAEEKVNEDDLPPLDVNVSLYTTPDEFDSIFRRARHTPGQNNHRADVLSGHVQSARDQLHRYDTTLRYPARSLAETQRVFAMRARARDAQQADDLRTAVEQQARRLRDEQERLLVHENQFTRRRQEERRQARAAIDANDARMDALRAEREYARVVQASTDHLHLVFCAQSAATYAQIARDSAWDPLNRHRRSRAEIERHTREQMDAWAASEFVPPLAPPPVIIDDYRWTNATISSVPAAEERRQSVRDSPVPTPDSRQSVYEGGTPRHDAEQSFDSLADTLASTSLTSPATQQPESPLTADPPRRRNGFDYRYAIDHVDINHDAGDMDPAGLSVRPSAYWGMRDGEVTNLVGDALFAEVDIEAGTLIATFRGVRITRQAARDIPEGENNYLISLQDGFVLDCMDNATARPVRCLASLANQADSLHDQVAQRFLTYDDNNAYVVWRVIDGVMEATLYAVRRIAKGEEIMWSYGPSFEYGFDADTIYSDTEDEEPSFEDDSSGSRALTADPQAGVHPQGQARQLHRVIRRLRMAGFSRATDGVDDVEDGASQYAFDNDNGFSTDEDPQDEEPQRSEQLATQSSDETPPMSPIIPTAVPVHLAVAWLASESTAAPVPATAPAQRRRITPVAVQPPTPATAESEERDGDSNVKGGGTA